jgi:hypothetical protein
MAEQDIDKEEIGVGGEELSEVDKLLIDAGYTKDELLDLSDEEKDGLLIKDDESSEEKDEIDNESLMSVIGEEAGETKDVDEKKEESVPGDPLTDEQLLSFRPVVRPEDLPSSDEVPAEFEKKLSDLEEKYDNGDMEQRDYQRERDKINREIIRAQDNAANVAKINKEWELAQGHFLRNRPEYLRKPDQTDPKVLLRSDALYGALGKMVDVIVSDPTKAHYTDMQILVEADRAVKEAFGINQKQAGQKSKAVDIARGKPAARMPEMVTLSDIPSDAQNSTEGDPFAAIDRLTGQAYEDAIERMTPAQKKAYEDSASRPSRRR